MTVNERIKYFRKNVLKLNQTDFAQSIGMKQRGASGMEQNGATVTDRAIKSICMAFNLNEDWLRNGTEPMYIQAPTFSLDKFIKDHGGTDLELEAMKAYFELDPDIRKMLVKHFKERLTASAPATAEESKESIFIMPKTSEEFEKQVILEDEIPDNTPSQLKKDITTRRYKSLSSR